MRRGANIPLMGLRRRPLRGLGILAPAVEQPFARANGEAVAPAAARTGSNVLGPDPLQAGVTFGDRQNGGRPRSFQRRAHVSRQNGMSSSGSLSWRAVSITVVSPLSPGGLKAITLPSSALGFSSRGGVVSSTLSKRDRRTQSVIVSSGSITSLPERVSSLTPSATTGYWACLWRP